MNGTSTESDAGRFTRKTAALLGRSSRPEGRRFSPSAVARGGMSCPAPVRDFVLATYGLLSGMCWAKKALSTLCSP